MNVRLPRNPDMAANIARAWPFVEESCASRGWSNFARPDINLIQPKPSAPGRALSRQYMIWTPAERETLARLWPTKAPLHAIEADLNRNYDALRTMARKLGLKRG